MGGSLVSDGLTIQSHAGPYSAEFAIDVLARLNADVPAETHFIIDERVAALYREEMANVLASPSVLLIEAREENKSLDRFPFYVEHLGSRQLRRDQVLIAIGGGIIQDITCFLAANMLRGVAWRFYPTTLLAQADSCIGSKSSINSGSAKNILGTFTPPRRVMISTPFLKTLDERDIRSGVGEMLKVHAIDGAASFDLIAGDYHRIFLDEGLMEHYIQRSLEIKKGYIERDEFDRGPRNIFNFGHSFGHAIEAATNFAIPHGIAVTIGMDMATWVSARLGIGGEDHYQRMHPALKRNYRGFEDHDVPLEPFMAALAKDKKNVGKGTVTLILPDRNAQVFKDVYAVDEGFRNLCATYLGEVRAA
jgi:3-dehydroquinate synthase